MRQLLEKISKSAIKLGDLDYSKDQIASGWLGSAPASLEAIKESENRLGMSLPDDYKLFLKTCNGFSAANATDPTFMPVGKIDFLTKLNPGIIQAWKATGNDVKDLARSILVAGIDEEQFFLLVPPLENENWRYWKFATWIPGEEEYNDLTSYFESVLEFNNEELEG
jgi:cell wall assembly regulator SMI1